MFSKRFPSLTSNLYNKCNTTAVLSRTDAISQQLHSGAIQLTSAALLRFMLLLDQNQAQYWERVNRQCQLYQARETQTKVILERSNNRCIDSPHIKQKCQCPTLVLRDHRRRTKQQRVDAILGLVFFASWSWLLRAWKSSLALTLASCRNLLRHFSTTTDCPQKRQSGSNLSVLSHTKAQFNFGCSHTNI